VSAHDIGPLVSYLKVVLACPEQLIGRFLVFLALGNRLNDATFFNQ
jgi:hypothetical protein